jgi:hypothetical protein
METIKIAELSINTDKLISEMKATKSQMDKLQTAQKELKESGQENSSQFIKNAADLKETKATYRSQEKTLREVSTAIEGLTTELNKEVKSLGDAEANNKALRKARRDVNATTEEGEKALQEINSKINENTDFMKSNQDAQVKQKMNVGNYRDSILEATGTQELYTRGTQAMTAAQRLSAIVVGKSTGAMKLFRIALASTGIGLIVLALGSLIAYFTQTQDGINKVNMVLTPLKVLFGEIKGVVEEVGASLAKLFSGGGIKAFFNDMASTGEKLKKSFGEAIKRGKEIENIKQNLSKTEAKFITQQSKLKKEFEEQNKIADDQTKSSEERVEAAKKAIAAQQLIAEENIKRIKQEARILKLKQMANDTSDEERAEIARKLAEIDEALEEEASKTKEAQNKLNSIRKTANDKEAADRKANAEARKKDKQEAINSAVKQMEDEITLFETKAEARKKTSQEELQFIKDKNAQELELLQYKRDNELLTEKEFQIAREELKNEEKAKEAQIAEEELAAIEDFNARKAQLEEEIYLADLETDEERKLLALDKQKEEDEAEIEKMKVDAEKKKELMALLEEQYQQKLTDIEDKNAEKRAKNKDKRAKEELQMREDVANARLSIASGLSGLLNQLVGEDASAQKAALLFEKGIAASRIIIQTQIANAKALAASPLTFGMPWIGYNNIQMGISLASIAAQTVAGFQKINKSKEQNSGGGRRFAKGGLLQGNSHANGGIKTPYGELEGDEAVINKKSTMKYGGLLSAVNMAEGGSPIGDFRPSGLINYDLLGAKMAEANRSLPNPIVGVDEISEVSQRSVSIQEKARF